MKDYSNKIVYVVGGSSGIGLAAAELFSEKGAHVCLFARNEERLQKAREVCRRPGVVPETTFLVILG